MMKKIILLFLCIAIVIPMFIYSDEPIKYNASAVTCDIYTGGSTNTSGSYTEVQNSACNITVNETYIVEYERSRTDDLAVWAGQGFDYPIVINSVITTNKEEIDIDLPRPPSSPSCWDIEECHTETTKTAICYGADGSNHGSHGGPDDDFDDCVFECDGGTYTQNCINKCSNLLYQISNDFYDYKTEQTIKFKNDFKVQFLRIYETDDVQGLIDDTIIDGTTAGGVPCEEAGSSAYCIVEEIDTEVCVVVGEECDKTQSEYEREYEEWEREVERITNQYEIDKQICADVVIEPKGITGVTNANMKITEMGVDTYYNELSVNDNILEIPYISYISKETFEATKDPIVGKPYYEGERFYYTDIYTPSTIFWDSIDVNIQFEDDAPDVNIICHYEVINKLFNDTGGLDIMFRPIDLYDVFPSRDPRWNWKTQEAIDLTTEIENKGDSIYSGTPDYQIILTPEDINSITNYNKGSNGNYIYDWTCSGTDESACSNNFIYRDYSNLFTITSGGQ